MRIYALYKGDEFITTGTKKELAEYLGVKKTTIDFYITKANSRRARGINNRRTKVIFIGIE